MFENIDYIYEVYKQGSFSKAAKTLFINQSSLSRTIQKADNKLGLRIFDRKTKPITLTAFGKRYIEAIEEINRLGQEIQTYIDNGTNEVRGQITIGAAAFAISYILPDLISNFHEQYPHVLVQLETAPTLELKEKLLKNNIDLMFSSEQLQVKAFQSYPLYRENMVLIVPDKWIRKEDKEKLARFSPIQVFQNVPFIMLRKGNSNRDKIEQLMTKYKIRIKPILEMDQNITACSMANAGIGATIVSESFAYKLCDEKRVHIYPLPDPEIQRINYVSCSSEASFLVQEFIRTAQHILSE